MISDDKLAKVMGMISDSPVSRVLLENNSFKELIDSLVEAKSENKILRSRLGRLGLEYFNLRHGYDE